MTVKDILQNAVTRRTSDVHLVADKPPLFRIDGELTVTDLPALPAAELKETLLHILSPQQIEVFEKFRELDCSYSGIEGYQFRANIYYEKGTAAATFRIMPTTLERVINFDFPTIMKKLARKRKGLVVISGTAGSGKSTTLTYIIDMINAERRAKIITIEDPIEYVHHSKKSLIIQREVGTDTPSFASALKSSLRQDPDVVVVGEVRDFESISMALTAAETGHLVMTTVHAADATETLNRIIDVYPMGHRDQLFVQLAGSLLGIISQTLVPRKDGNGRILATEVLAVNISIQNLIRRGALIELRGQMHTEEDEDMHTLEIHLSELYRKGIISRETALEYAKYPNMLKWPEETQFSHSTHRQAQEKVSEIPMVERPDQRVLIIDGYEKDCQSMKDTLRKQRYKDIHIAHDGKEGLAMAYTVKPHLIILDTQIYDIECFDLCQQLKKISNPTPHVMMITGSLQIQHMEKARIFGADDFVVKTAAYDLFIKALNKINIPL